MNIKIQSHKDIFPDGEERSVSITHLRAQKNILNAPVVPTSSPGLVILWPAGSAIQVVCDDKTFALVEGASLIAHGNRIRLITPDDASRYGEHEDGILYSLELNAIINENCPLQNLLVEPKLCGFEDTSTLTQFHQQLASSLSVGRSPRPASSLSKGLWAGLLTSWIWSFLNEDSPTSPNPRLQLFQNYCLEHIAENVTADTMAHALKMSRSGLYEWIKPLIGMSPMRYLRILRMERCQELLTNTDLSLDTIALNVGHANRYHLSRQFKNMYGTSPAQYKKRRGQKGVENQYAEACRLIDAMEYAKALDILNLLLPRCNSPEDKQRMRMQKASCLHAMKKTAKAIAIWKTLGDTVYADEATLATLRASMHNGDHDEFHSSFKDAFAKSRPPLRKELIQLWIHYTNEVLDTRSASLLRAALSVREELFANDSSTSDVVMRALMALGQDHRILQEAPDLSPISRLWVLRKTGQYAKISNDLLLGISPYRHASILNEAGRYQEVLDNYPHCRKDCAIALTHLGRPEEAIKRYPEFCYDALLALRHYEEILSRFPDDQWLRLEALCALGRLDEVAADLSPDSSSWTLVQLHLNPQVIADKPESNFHDSAILLLALRELANENVEKAAQLLHTIPLFTPDTFWVKQDSSTILILAPLLRQWLGEDECVEQQYQSILEHCRYLDRQRPWHHVAYVLGKLDDDGFLNQPMPHDSKTRLLFAQALHHDLNNQKKAAKVYREYIAARPPATLGANHLFDAFAAWRLQALANKR